MQPDFGRRFATAFADETTTAPSMTLRAGHAIDSYNASVGYDATLDEPTDAYFQRYGFSGLAHLDARSWRHYLPYLIDYALRNTGNGGDLVVEALLTSLRPPDREPPRLASLTPEQEAVVTEFLETLAFQPDSAFQELAMQVLGEYWVPNALYRNDAD